MRAAPSGRPPLGRASRARRIVRSNGRWRGCPRSAMSPYGRLRSDCRCTRRRRSVSSRSRMLRPARSDSPEWRSSRKQRSPPGGELLRNYSPGGEPICNLRAAARRAAVRALVAGAVAHHQRAALVARRRVGLLHPRAVLHLDRDRGLHAGLHLDRDEVLRRAAGPSAGRAAPSAPAGWRSTSARAVRREADARASGTGSP